MVAALLVRGGFGVGDNAAPASLLIDTSLTAPAGALDAAGWKKSGRRRGQAAAEPAGRVDEDRVCLPSLRLGAFDVPQVPGLQSDETVKEREDGLGVELDGMLGSGLLATFRMTLLDGGRTMWLEDILIEALQPPRSLLAEVDLSEVEPDEGSEEPEEGRRRSPDRSRRSPLRSPHLRRLSPGRTRCRRRRPRERSRERTRLPGSRFTPAASTRRRTGTC